MHEKYMFWSNLNCKFEFFLRKKYTVGAVGTVAAPTNRFVGAADNTSRLYKSGGGYSINRPYSTFFRKKKIKFTIQIRPEHIFFMHNSIMTYLLLRLY